MPLMWFTEDPESPQDPSVSHFRVPAPPPSSHSRASGIPDLAAHWPVKKLMVDSPRTYSEQPTLDASGTPQSKRSKISVHEDKEGDRGGILQHSPARFMWRGQEITVGDAQKADGSDSDSDTDIYYDTDEGAPEVWKDAVRAEMTLSATTSKTATPDTMTLQMATL